MHTLRGMEEWGLREKKKRARREAGLLPLFFSTILFFSPRHTRTPPHPHPEMPPPNASKPGAAFALVLFLDWLSYVRG